MDLEVDYKHDVQVIKHEVTENEVLNPLKSHSLGDSIRNMPQPSGLPGSAGIVAEKTREVVGQVGVEVGRGMGTFAKGVAEGFLETNKEAAAEVADKLEGVIENKKSEK